MGEGLISCGRMPVCFCFYGVQAEGFYGSPLCLIKRTNTALKDCVVYGSDKRGYSPDMTVTSTYRKGDGNAPQRETKP